MTNSHTWRKRFLFHLTIWSLFSLFTIVMLYPCIPLFSIGNKIQYGDASFFAWCIAWIQRAVLHQPAQLFHANILYPLPYSLVYTAALYTPAFLSLPIRLVTENPVFIHNVMVYLSFIIAGTGAFYFVRRVSGSVYGAILGGFIFAFCSQRLWRANGHLNILQSCWIPYFYLALLSFYQSAQWKHAILVGLSVIALILGCFYNTVIAAAGALLLTIYWGVTKEFRIRPRMFLTLLVVLISVSAIVYPFVHPYAKIGEIRFNIVDDLIEHSASLREYFLPPHEPHWCITLMGQLFYKQGSKPAKGEDIEFLGYFVLLLALIELFLALRHKSTRGSSIFYACFALLFLVISLGPYFKTSEGTLSFPMPYYFIYKFVHPLNFMRAINRYSILVFLALAVLVGRLWSRSFFQTQTKWRAFLIFLVSLLIIGVEYFSLSFATTHTFAQSQAYAYLKGLPDDTVVLDVSTAPSNAALNSTLHWKKIIGGAYLPRGYYQDLLSMTRPGKLTWLLYNKYTVNYVVCDTLKSYEQWSTLPYFTKTVPEVPGVLKFVSPDPSKTIEQLSRELEARGLPTQAGERRQARMVITKEAFKKCPKSASIKSLTLNPYVYCTTRRVNSSEFPIQPFLPATLPKISVTMRAKSPVDTRTLAAFYWSTPELPENNEENAISWIILLDNEFHTYTLDMSTSWQWVTASRILRLRFDPVAGRNIEFEIQEIRLSEE